LGSTTPDVRCRSGVQYSVNGDIFRWSWIVSGIANNWFDLEPAAFDGTQGCDALGQQLVADDCRLSGGVAAKSLAVSHLAPPTLIWAGD